MLFGSEAKHRINFGILAGIEKRIIMERKALMVLYAIL